ncbi:hypothetical protein B0H66DRAFT_23661 [Apodospora peruviana]|uniref:Cell wall proline rich protein n=1 Tax=Apodospora peruviana TaxID=516989 RepID=A0AAE0IQY0_9PEZI|nr:hypothetical protein B0H66DRAFT_23661 [Apodospora peruviana]
MAATLGPDMMVGAPTTDCLDDTTAQHLVDRVPLDSMAPKSTSLTSPLASPRSVVPLPNPPFVFPARPLSSSSAPSSFSRATGRRPRSAIDPQVSLPVVSVEIDKHKPKSPALPAFSFNPGASLPSALSEENAFLSPLQSPSAPSSPRSVPARITGHGHRRGASEFVGGNIRSGEAITVLSASPTKSESGMASPMLQPTKPASRRGHAHRRSAAISSHDLSSIILPSPNQKLRGCSAPTSPAAVERPEGPDFPAAEISPTRSEPVLSATTEAVENAGETAPLSVVEPDQRSKPVARNRVGFSDTLEFIPRPLSLVSSDTSSTITARPGGHSVSGSISSLISLNIPDLSSPASLTSSRVPNETRPSTAGAVLERTQSSQDQDQALPSPRRRGSIPLLGPLPPPTPVSDATPSPTKTSKKWSLFGLDSFVASSPTRTRPASAGSSETQSHPAPSTVSAPNWVSDIPAEELKSELAELKPLTKKRSKKQKKVKAWSILSRKSKTRHGKQKKRSPTPPPLRQPHPEDDDMFAEPEHVMPTVLVTETGSDEELWTHSGSSSVPDEDISYPMIDLDAALGPFNTPVLRNPEWEAAQRAAGLIKKQLHSAAGMSRFTGPGMHYTYHRRTESAPEMVSFEGGRFGFPRFGSSSTMADVFEEDEEEDDDDESVEKSTGQSTPVVEQSADECARSSIPAEDEGDSSATTTKNTTPTDDRISAPLGVQRTGNEVSDNESPLGSARMRSCHSAISLHDEAFVEEYPGSAPIRAQGDRSMENSPTASPCHAVRPKDLSPVEVAPLSLPSASLAPVSPYSMTQSSAFPSPRSPMSYDAHRISTAPSSITEDNFQSLLLGEPGPEVRISVDDIPSLTSSNSTMTRESIFAHNPQARHPPLDQQPRPASFTATAFGRRRSSLASLSRLISSSHGERSKLSMEVTLDNEPDKKTKVSKTKRLSRMVQFWKSKETDTA